jgi:hypothetical protein
VRYSLEGCPSKFIVQGKYVDTIPLSEGVRKIWWCDINERLFRQDDERGRGGAYFLYTDQQHHAGYSGQLGLKTMPICRLSLQGLQISIIFKALKRPNTASTIGAEKGQLLLKNFKKAYCSQRCRIQE